MRRAKRLNWKICVLILGVIGLASSLAPPRTNLFGVELNRTVVADDFIPSPAIEGTVFAVTAGNNLISFNQFAPSAIIRTTAITGLAAGENILGIDFRPRTGVLFAVSNQSRVYTINPSTGAATQVGTTVLTPAVMGTSFGFDFNPVPDRIRFVTDADQDLRLNPDTGGVAGTDGTLAFATGDPNAGANPNAVAAAYTNNFSGATTTSLYVIDSNLDVLALQGSAGGAPVSPNTGMLTTVGPLGVNTTDQVGFDIASPSGLALASLTPMGAMNSSLYSINLMTGAATLIGPIGGMEIVSDIAVVVRVETIFALTANNVLIAFNSGLPNNVVLTRPVTGLGMGENLVGIDFRPATGELYGMTNQSRVYIINTSTGAATPAGGAPFAPALAGANFGFDFNPVPDRIRVTSDMQQNIRLNPNTGAGVMPADTNLAFAMGDPNQAATPRVVASAYTNNFAGTASTSLYGIDSQLNALVLQGSLGGTPVSPNTGQLTTVGMLTVDTTEDVGFDISPVTGAAFASLTLPGSTSSSTLFTINLATGAATQIGAIGGSQTIRDIAIASNVETILAVTASNKLISFQSTAPGVILSQTTITGLTSGDMITGIDFRPATSRLFAVSNTSRIYTIDPLSGASVQNGPVLTPVVTGTSFGIDFNPVPDRIRLVSTSGQNLRIVPDTGVATTDGMLAYAATDPRMGQTPNIVAAAYNNNFAGSTSTTLYVIDSMFDSLVTQGSPGSAPVSPNTGTLFTVGPLGVDTSEVVAFDIADGSNNAFAALTVGGMQQLYSINLQTGAATAIGAIGGGEQIRGITVINTPPPSQQSTGATLANAASFATNAAAPGSLAALFGKFQTMNGQLFTASSQPLPTMLGGVSVQVNGLDAGLLATSNSQINLALPQMLTDGPATIVVTNAAAMGANMMTSVGTINIQRSATGIFTFFANGQGTPAAVVTTDGVNFQPVFNPDGSPRAVSAGSAGTPNFLVLFTTGLRNTPAANPMDTNGIAEAVTVMVGSASAMVTFAGPAPGLVGVDQVNLMIPPQLAGAGVVNVTLTAGTFTSNTVQIRIQ